MTLLHSLADLLDTAGIGTYRADQPYQASDTAIFLGDSQAAPARQIVLSGYPTSPARGSSNQAEVTARVQVRVLAATEPESWGLCQAISDLLDGHPAGDLAGGMLLLNAVMQQQDPIYRGVDKSNRHETSTVVEVEYLRPGRRDRT